jgi:O-methyltransferase
MTNTAIYTIVKRYFMFDLPENIYKKEIADEAISNLKTVYPQNFCGDSMFVANRNMNFYHDDEFMRCMNSLVTGEPYFGMAWRMLTMIWSVTQALAYPGAIMEFGTFRGFKMKFVMEYFGNKLDDRDVYLFDTFNGIDPEQIEGSPNQPDEHQKAQLYRYIVNRFKAHKNVRIVKGAAPGSLDQVSLGKISFIHLDMNSWMAEIGTLERIWDNIVLGGVVLLDDFGFTAHKAQNEKELLWFKERGHTPLELPRGQGMVIKNV